MAYRIEAVKNRAGQVHTFANVANVTTQAKAVKVRVTKQIDGPVTSVQKIQGYYKSLVAFVGALLVLLNQVTPVTSFLPAVAQHWFSVIVAGVTAVSILLIKNQNWVDDL